MKMFTKTTALLLAAFSLVACYDDIVKDSSATPTLKLDIVPPAVTLNGSSTISINVGDTFIDPPVSG